MKNLIICPRGATKNILKKYRENDQFVDVKVLSKEDLLRECCYQYSDEAVVYLIKKYGYDYKTAISCLEDIKYLDDVKYGDAVLDEAGDILRDLIENALVTKNIYFDYELDNSDIYVEYYSKDDKEIAYALKGREIKGYSEYKNNNYKLYHFSDSNEELYFVFNKICELLDNGVKPEDIYLYGLIDDNELLVNRLTKSFGVNLNNSFSKKYITNPEVRKFIELYNGDLKDSLSYIDKSLVDQRFLDIVKTYQISTLSLDKQKDLYKDIFTRLAMPNVKYKEGIKVVNEPICPKNGYLFIINFSQGVYPASVRDDTYLEDADKLNAKVPTSSDINYDINILYKNCLQQDGTIILTYSDITLSGNLLPSPFKKMLNIKDETNNNLNKVYNYNEGRLYYAGLIDLHVNYNFNEPILYQYASGGFVIDEYQNQVDSTIEIYKPLQAIELSYSEIKTYRECPFKYYFGEILKFDPFESNFNTAIGNIMHNILQNINKGSFDELYAYAYAQSHYDFTNEEKVLMIRIKDELRKVYNYIKEMEKQIPTKDISREIKLYADYVDNISLTGRIDKLILSGDDKNITIVDYKTGSEEYKKDQVSLGFSQQLPIYSLLLKSNPEYEDKNILGLFIQCVLSKDVKKYCKSDTEEYINDSKLKGVYLNDEKTLKTLDTSIDGRMKSKYIYSLDFNKDGYIKSARAFGKEYFDEISEIAEKTLIDTGHNIQNNNFVIQPKRIKGNDVSCSYCPFKDICFRKYEDYEFLTSVSSEEEDENNA